MTIWLEGGLRAQGDPQTAMAAADLALTKSGSVNLQLALLDIPQVVVYRIDSPTAWLVRRLFDFHIPRVSLCNLVGASAC